MQPLSPIGQVIEGMFRIYTKSGEDVDFILNAVQRKFDAEMTGRDRVPKARQLGMSTYILARFFACCLLYKNRRCVVISHDIQATQIALAKVHYMIENIKGPAPVIKTSSRNAISFPKTNSIFYIGTAGNAEFGRGDTITNLHCSEIAFWPDPKSIVAGLYQAVPYDGEIIEESTGNGVGNYYHKQCMNSYQGEEDADALATGQRRFKLHFFNWIGWHEYRVPLTAEQAERVMANLVEEMEEPQLVEEYGVEPEQLVWRRAKIDEFEGDLRLFKQEYPATLDECFQATGHSLFQKATYVLNPFWKQQESDGHYWEDEKAFGQRRGRIYAIGVDPAGGVGLDYSVIDVIDVMANKQVAQYRNNRIDPDQLPLKIKYIGERWNEAFVTIESNNHGMVVILEFKKIYPIHLIYTHVQDTDKLLEYGFKTTAKTKPLLINTLRAEFNAGLVIQSIVTKSELSTFAEQDNGKLEAESGCHDDTVMSLAICCLGAQKSTIKLQAEAAAAEKYKRDISPFSLEGIIAEFENKRGTMGESFPIPPQHRMTFH